MPLGLFADENAQALDTLQRGTPMGPAQAKWYEGLPTAIGEGLATGVGKIGEMVGTGIAETVSTVIKAEQAAAPWSGPLQALKPDDIVAQTKANADAYLNAHKISPVTVGYAGQVLNSVADVGVRFMGGPTAEAGAVLAGASEFLPAQREAEALGLDKDTATQLAGAQAVMTGAGALLPGGVGGKTVVRMASGAALNTAVGAGARYNAANVLNDAGYPDQAKQYRVLDGQALAADAILGSFFGWMHKPTEPVGTSRMPQAAVDAAHGIEDAHQGEVDLAPGIPATPEARNNHFENLAGTTGALIRGDTAPTPRPVEAVPDPAQDALHATAVRGVDNAVSELSDAVLGTLGEPREAPARVEPDVTTELTDFARQFAPKVEGEMREPVNRGLDAATAEAVMQAREAVARDPAAYDKLAVTDPETGVTANAHEALQNALRELDHADTDAMLHEVAAACGIRA